MTDWHTNLIKNYVPSPPQRRIFYLSMLGFLALCGISLVAIAYQATQRLVHTVREQRMTRHLEARFREFHGGLDGNLAQVAHQLEKDLQQTHAQLQSASDLVDRRFNLSRVLAGLRQPLPPDMQLIRFDLLSSRDTARFDLVMPDQPDRELEQARALVEAWNHQPLLASELTDIRIVARQTQRVGDRSVAVLRLEGEIAGEKK